MSNPNKQTPYTQSGQALERQANSNQQNPTTAALQRHRSFFEARLPQIQKWVTQGVRAEAIVRFALMECSTNDKLRECSEQSIYLGLLACAVTGLEPGALKGEAYLVPFAKQAVFMPGWKGLVKQARRSREIQGIVANVVREADTFDIDLGTANNVVHRPARTSRGEVIGAYAIATMVGGFHEIEWMDREDLDAIEKVATSRGKSPAWDGWQDQMQRKSVIRRLAKRLPLGTDYFVGLALEQAVDQGQIIDIETDGEATNAARGARASDEIRSQASPAAAPANTTPPAKEEPKATPAAAPAKAKTKEAAPKPAPQPAAAAAAPPSTKEGYEDRACEACGVPIEVPASDPPGGRCYACASSGD